MLDTIEPQITEIVEYLAKVDNYFIWAGFAQHAHLKLPYSPDIDICVGDTETRDKILDRFITKGWIEISNKLNMDSLRTLIKSNVTFDIKLSVAACSLFHNDHEMIEIYGNKLVFISKEGLFLTKLGQMSSYGRTKEKIERDRETISLLRPLLDITRLRKIVHSLPDEYWTTGLI